MTTRSRRWFSGRGRWVAALVIAALIGVTAAATEPDGDGSDTNWGAGAPATSING